MPYKDKEKQKRAQQKHYQEHKKEYNDRVRNRRKKNRKLIWDIKSNKKCKICGEDHPACLVFHHIRDKSNTIANYIRSGVAIDKLLKEIDKCEVLCANCHMKLHNVL